jgi:hypothetical protein
VMCASSRLVVEHMVERTSSIGSVMSATGPKADIAANRKEVPDAGVSRLHQAEAHRLARGAVDAASLPCPAQAA